MKTFQVKIEHNYLLRAKDSREAIAKSMDRFMGRKFKDVQFEGMVTTAEITKRPMPEVKIKQSKEKEVTHGQTIPRDRTDSKEQEYIHFSESD